MTPKKPDLSKIAAILGSVGGKVRADNLSAEQRRAIAKMGGLARQKQMTQRQREELAASGGKGSKGVPKTKRKDNQ